VEWIGVAERFEPKKEVHAKYDRYYRLYRKLYQDISKTMHLLADIEGNAKEKQ
jgi:sugar (pentulose or hexulose) kinase